MENVDRKKTTLKLPPKLLILSFMITFSSSFQYGYATTYINTAQSSFANYLNQSFYDRHNLLVSDNTLTWIWAAIVNSLQVGLIIGTVLVPFAAEKCGRRLSLLLTEIPEIIGILMCIAAIPLQVPALFFLGRLMLSIGAGLNFAVATLFVQEISPTAVRGLLSSFLEFSLCISTIIGLILGLPSVLGCETCLLNLIAVGLVGPLLRTILFFCPDTPKYLFLKLRNSAKAEHSIKFYHGSDVDVKSVLDELTKEGNLDKLQHPQSGGGSDSSKRSIVSIVKQLWNDKQVRKAIILGSVVYTAIQATGIIPIYEFSTVILIQTGLSTRLAELGTIVMSALNTVFTISAIVFVDHFGRRKLLLIGLSGLMLCLVTFVTFDFVHRELHVSWAGYGAMVALILHSIIYSTGPGPICWYITAELVPQHLRSTAQATTQFWNQIIDLIISFVFFPAYSSIGPYSFIILFIVPLGFCLLYLYLELPETKNKEISDIVLAMKSKQKKKETFVEKF